VEKSLWERRRGHKKTLKKRAEVKIESRPFTYREKVGEG
jgi:hypothetical protein